MVMISNIICLLWDSYDPMLLLVFCLCYFFGLKKSDYKITAHDSSWWSCYHFTCLSPDLEKYLVDWCRQHVCMIPVSCTTLPQQAFSDSWIVPKFAKVLIALKLTTGGSPQSLYSGILSPLTACWMQLRL